jgi:hypothetical protein
MFKVLILQTMHPLSEERREYPLDWRNAPLQLAELLNFVCI